MGTMDVDSARLIWDMAQTGMTAAIGLFVWWTNRTRATTKAIEQVDERVNKLDHDVRRLEQTLQNQPGYSDVEHLRENLAETNRTLAKVAAELAATTALLNRVHEFLLAERRER